MKRIVSLICFGLVFLVGCNIPGPEPTQEIDVVTSTVETDSEAGTDVVPTETVNPKPTATSTSEPTASPPEPVPPKAKTPDPKNFPTPQPLLSGDPVTITQIRMFDLNTGWATGFQNNSGAHVFTTEDGGTTWIDRTPPEQIADASEENESAWAHFSDPQTAWVIYAPQRTPPPISPPVIWRTTDGGLSWKPSPPLDLGGMEDFFTPEGFAAQGVENGWLLVHVGAGMSHDYSFLFATCDGGSTWERIVDPYGIGIQSLHNTGLAFADESFGWVTKDNLGIKPGAFFEQTIDGGATWEQVFLPAPPELDWFNETSLCKTSSPNFTVDRIGALIVKCRLPEDIQKGTSWSLTYIYTTSDRGETWEFVRLPSPVERLVFLDKDIGWALGRDHYQTTDGGVTWEMGKTVNWDGEFSFIDQQNGWAVVRNEDQIALVVTDDGGDSWQIIEATIH
jgi:photosystem II stability/assembly factor-like uncharacterized protein